jgi:alpha-amylase/alpha-mannosidase (GH57 family)
MHQPDYRHPQSGVPIMPWVRLHGTRGYRDLPKISVECGANITINLVGTLVEQIDHYAGGGSDLHLDLCRAPVETLSPTERHFITTHFLHGSERAYGWFPGWQRLRAHRDSGKSFDNQDILDLQVWCNLAWFGSTALADFPELADYRTQGQGFTEKVKQRVLAIQAQCLRELRSLYAACPDISASPYAHPILPLLVDTGHARRNLGDIPDPGFRHPEDALAQLIHGRQVVSRWVGREVRGLWPSEGSISPEVVELAAQAGFRWFASDEGVLHRSEREGEGSVWRCGPMHAIFRDQQLSDRIGFHYQDWPGEAAAADLHAQLPTGNRVLVLDGENPWESYPDAGASFLRSLYAKVKLQTASTLTESPATGRIVSLHTGSWIGANFAIWIGHEADRAAWRLLEHVRAACAAHLETSGVQLALFRAEASDWFWWYGPEFSTPFADDFDFLFRAHLRRACELAGVAVPTAVNRPLATRTAAIRPPNGPLHPTESGWFAWANAGSVQLPGSAMAHGGGAQISCEYGWIKNRFALRESLPAGWKTKWIGAESSEAPSPVRLSFVDPEGHEHPSPEGYLLLPPPTRPEQG